MCGTRGPRNDRSPVTVKAVVAVVIAVAVMAPAAMRNPEHALDRAHGAADTGPDSAAHDTADRTCDPVALIGAFLRSAHDALGVSDVRNGQ
jgi:hypothetical protein